MKFLGPAATIYEVSGVPTIFPGSNTFFLVRIPDTRYQGSRLSVYFPCFLPRSMYLCSQFLAALLTQEVRTNQSFGTTDPHKFFHADSRREHATKSWITMSVVTLSPQPLSLPLSLSLSLSFSRRFNVPFPTSASADVSTLVNARASFLRY